MSTEDAKVVPGVTVTDNAKDEGKKEELGPMASLSEMCMLAERDDYLLFFFGCLGAVINGTGDPLMMLFFSEGLQNLSGDVDDMYESMVKVAIMMCFVGLGLFFAAWLQYACFTALAKRMTQKLREEWFKSVVRQDVGWFDVNSPGEMPGRISSALVNYEEGIGSKFCEGVQFFSTLCSGWFLGFFFNAYVSCVIFACVPLIAYSGTLLVQVNQESADFKDKSYSRANAVAYEVLGSLRTLLSFNGTTAMANKYYKETEDAEVVGVKRSKLIGFANGLMMASFILMYMAITLFGTWMLSKQVRELGCDPSGGMDPRIKCDYFDLPGEVTGQGVLIALLCIAFGGQAMGQIAAAVEAFTTARQTCGVGFAVIKRIPDIDTGNQEGHSATSVEGNIAISNATFAYPSRPDTDVCSGFSLDVPAGTTLALVGESGSGKSTTVSLVQRFYDPSAGSVSLDGVDLKKWNVNNLRSHISLVGQEPKLFTGTIYENIVNGAQSNPKLCARITKADVEGAARMANAHDFIMKFPQGYETQVGFGGSQMSGGQKQRIAIARAVLKNPAILLLDEATSALDTRSERVVQAALDKLVQEGGGKRTTIIIAHRLTTIRNADQIGFIKDGRISELGSHEELMKSQLGHYRAMVEAQASTVDNIVASSSVDNDLADMNGESSPMPSTFAAKTVAGAEGVMVTSGDIELGAVGMDSKDGKKEDTAVEKGGSKEEEEEDYPVEWARVWELNKDDHHYLALGVLGALLVGGGYPFWGIVFGWMMTLYFTPVPPCELADDDACQTYYDDVADDMWADAIELTWWWIGIVILVMVGNQCLFFGFGAASERLSHRVRDVMFNAYITQEPGYFDMPENSVGAVCGRLASDATLIKAKTGEPLQAAFVTCASLGTGLTVAGVYCWPVCLVSIATLPIIGAAMQLQMETQLGLGERVQGESPESLAVVGETVNAIRTVASLGLEDKLVAQYATRSRKSLEGLQHACMKKGITLGLSVAINHWDWALLLWFGAWVITNHPTLYSFEDFNIALFGFFFGLFGLAAAGQGAAGATEAKRALKNVFKLLDRTTKIDPHSKDGTQLTSVSGQMALSEVNFTYPSRPDLQVCNNYSLKVEAGTSIGLVGQSGSGKSTAIQLLERFYDPDSGKVTLDCTPLDELNYQWLHGNVGYVGQEPVLYKGSVAENIWLGGKDKLDSTDTVTRDAAIQTAMPRIMECAKEANAHSFVSEFPEGYDADVGTGGDRLSGGQKQRIAIARALMSEPKVLLLDEATSALDTESEKVVQSALDNLIKTKKISSVTIAHRLSTVQDLNSIHVVSKGAIVESGSHSQLMAKGGIYADLARTTKS